MFGEVGQHETVPHQKSVDVPPASPLSEARSKLARARAFGSSPCRNSSAARQPDRLGGTPVAQRSRIRAGRDPFAIAGDAQELLGDDFLSVACMHRKWRWGANHLADTSASLRVSRPPSSALCGGLWFPVLDTVSPRMKAQPQDWWSRPMQSPDFVAHRVLVVNARYPERSAGQMPPLEPCATATLVCCTSSSATIAKKSLSNCGSFAADIDPLRGHVVL